MNLRKRLHIDLTMGSIVPHLSGSGQSYLIQGAKALSIAMRIHRR